MGVYQYGSPRISRPASGTTTDVESQSTHAICWPRRSAGPKPTWVAEREPPYLKLHSGCWTATWHGIGLSHSHGVDDLTVRISLSSTHPPASCFGILRYVLSRHESCLSSWEQSLSIFLCLATFQSTFLSLFGFIFPAIYLSIYVANSLTNWLITN